uniref:Uncharacterized protein n=1 Tax=Candidatus Kentrum sp. FW TaxID=2126338 RepID=A0A450SRU6_9GAMM|nr:MAG: hypothetical protein BECKFW1821A_GA0114235_106420 [Candidatus Kentron sp. FW]VFJ69916.1 MAG: hypothetical protein BECKFW1821B_GA0114236_11744 [Candidatus Kentron sp. FW]
MSAIQPLLHGNNLPFPPSGSWPEFHYPKYSHDQVEGFNSLVKYLVRLRREETIDDGDFHELVKMASAAFVEAEISNRVENVLGSKALNKTLNDQLLKLWK